jgi:cysteinyl-tRNA synthetase
VTERKQPRVEERYSEKTSDNKEESFWDGVHILEAEFDKGLEKYDPKETANALLELDRIIWKAQQDLENEEFITQAREIMREMIVLLGTRLEFSPKSKTDCLAPVVEKLLSLREQFRKDNKWEEADAIREALQQAEIMIEDTRDGARWRVGDTDLSDNL